MFGVVDVVKVQPPLVGVGGCRIADAQAVVLPAEHAAVMLVSLDDHERFIGFQALDDLEGHGDGQDAAGHLNDPAGHRRRLAGHPEVIDPAHSHKGRRSGDDQGDLYTCSSVGDGACAHFPQPVPLGVDVPSTYPALLSVVGNPVLTGQVQHGLLDGCVVGLAARAALEEGVGQQPGPGKRGGVGRVLGLSAGGV